MEASIKDLRLHTKALMAATDRGEHITIPYRGKPRARLLPIEEQTSAYQAQNRGRNPAFGLWADTESTESVDEQVRRLRKPRTFD